MINPSQISHSVAIYKREHRSVHCLFLHFSTDEGIIQLIEALGCRYSETYRAWYMIFTLENYHRALSQLKDKVPIMDYVGQPDPGSKDPENTIKAKNSRPYPISLSDEKEEEVREFTEFLLSQRYSKSTRTLY